MTSKHPGRPFKPNATRHQFAECLKDIMKRQNLSRETVLSKLGISSHTLTSWLTGRRKPRAVGYVLGMLDNEPEVEIFKKTIDVESLIAMKKLWQGVNHDTRKEFLKWVKKHYSRAYGKVTFEAESCTVRKPIALLK